MERSIIPEFSKPYFENLVAFLYKEKKEGKRSILPEPDFQRL